MSQRFLIVIALCIAIPDLLLIPQIIPAAQQLGSHVTEWHVESLLGELVRPVLSLCFVSAVARGRWFLGAAIYLALRIIVPVLLAVRSPQVISWAFAPIILHIFAFAGVIYAMRHKPNRNA